MRRKVGIKRPGPRGLKTFLEYELQRLVVAGERRGAMFGAGHAFRRGRFGAFAAQRASAADADAYGFGIVVAAFHGRRLPQQNSVEKEKRRLFPPQFKTNLCQPVIGNIFAGTLWIG